MIDTAVHASQGGESRAMAYFRERAKWRWPEIVLWVVAFALAFVFPSRALLFNEVAILALSMALFCKTSRLSLRCQVAKV